ncbi:MAG TPA: DUF4956 domain-containing protein, partial [Vicinamibacteria bacterium]|nr:DUF4956 domain-containing protein [Vicinamibacteria bacterium]
LAGSPSHPLLRVVVYYVILFGAAAGLVSLAPSTLDYLNAPPPISGLVSGLTGATGAPGVTAEAAAPWRVVAATVISLASACALMLPVTWVYVQTRRKKGFEQSIVQTLIFLPLVVSGVILLVQNSAALAFSLGGIVGAVSFRNRLRDTKDTIFIFLAIVIGVAAGVHAMLVAATISVLFNAVAVVMWWTDFGRSGAQLEGPPARERLERAKAMANRSSAFISMVDRELLRSMAPEQLEVLAERARTRQRKAEARAGIAEEGKDARDRTLRIETGPDPAQGRSTVEQALSWHAKRYDSVSETAEGGVSTVLYRIRLKKSTTSDQFLERFRASAADAIRKAEFID